MVHTSSSTRDHARQTCDIASPAIAGARGAVAAGGLVQRSGQAGSLAPQGIVPEDQWVSFSSWSLLARWRGGVANVS